MIRVAAALWLFAGAAQASILMNSIVGLGGFDASIRIGTGTGTVFRIEFNGSLETLCIVTADHVLGATAPTTIGIRGSMNGGFDVTAVSSTQNRRGVTGEEDLASVQFTVDLSRLTDIDQIDALALMTPESLAAAPASTPFDIRAYGYGATARPSTAAERINFGGALYIRPVGDAAFGYGVERTYTATIEQEGSFNQDGYQYNDMTYFFADNGDGFGLGGDSGQGLIADGKVVGVYTRARTRFFDDAGQPCTPPQGMCTVEAIYRDNPGSGLAFTDEDVDWLNGNCTTCSVPEPGTWLLALTGAALVWRRYHCRG